MAFTKPDLILPDRTWVKIADQPGYGDTAGVKLAIENKSDRATVYVVYGGAAAPGPSPVETPRGMSLSYGQIDAQTATAHWVCSINQTLRRGAPGGAGLISVTVRD